MFPERLKQARKDKGLTLAELASLYNQRFNGEDNGLNKGTLSKYENERQSPLVDTVSNLAEILGVSTDYLLGKSEWKNEAERASRLAQWEVEFNLNGKVAQETAVFERFIVQIAQSGGGGQMEFGKYLQMTFGSAALELLEAFAKLNEQGKEEAAKRLDELTKLDQYRAEPEKGSMSVQGGSK